MTHTSRAASGRSGSDGWSCVLADVEVFEDSCNVYAVHGPAGTLFVNAGTGLWIDSLPDRFARPYTLVCTHYFRDHAAGASLAATSGFRVLAPETELALFTKPLEHFRAHDGYLVYENIWEHFCPVTTCDAEPARDYKTLDLAGLAVTVLPLPGVTPGQSGYALTTPSSGQAIVFCGEAIQSAGRLARIAPLQYDYHDLTGAVNAVYSARRLRDRQPDAVMPSLGAPILRRPSVALAQLEASLVELCAGRPDESALIEGLDNDVLVRVSDHVWMSAQSEAITWVLVSDSRKALAIDYGYRAGLGIVSSGEGRTMAWPAYPTRARRRPLLHTIKPLRDQLDIEAFSTVMVSHYHDDHVAGIPLLQRLFGTECWVPDGLADLLEHPSAHRFPCTWSEPIRVDRRLARDRVIEWEGIPIHVTPMSGHTRFSALIGFEVDGYRFAHTGDQYLFWGLHPPGNYDWRREQLVQTHVYRNGAFLDSYRESASWLDRWRPNIILSGHEWPIQPDETFFARLREWGKEYANLHRAAMVLGDDEVHFGLDSRPGWIWPYRIRASVGKSAPIEVRLRNPLPETAELHARLVVPDHWPASTARVVAPPRAEVSCQLIVTPVEPCRSLPIAVELRIGGRTFGQVLEALVTTEGARSQPLPSGRPEASRWISPHREWFSRPS